LLKADESGFSVGVWLGAMVDDNWHADENWPEAENMRLFDSLRELRVILFVFSDTGRS
jgi:hypothetical protein